ncbi:MAG: TonB-dependent receptor plug [Candidatus Acidoferrum typicum]|nr:TonB-dependent receptor plug [Candidatus Acidoferrum typicum]
MLRWPILVSTLLLISLSALSQTPTATIDGRVLDLSKAVIQGATVEAINLDTNAKHTTETNGNGLFTIVHLTPGNYRLEVSKPGFRTIVKPNVVLHVQDVIALNFEMSVGSTLETVTVTGGAPLVNTEDASVSTVVDRNFAENLPMNGRSFQSLIDLTPGVVVTPVGITEGGQFSTDGQRANSNYWMVDGVSANVGLGVNLNGNPGNGLAGSVGSFSAQGSTSSLVSVDALQEFRIETSTYAPEFGRTPGAQISIITRSGTNDFHGTLFDYIRNDVLDANDWFADRSRLPKPEERQNDFGGTFGGPLKRNRTFLFVSYEGLRLRLPQVLNTEVPDISSRQSAPPAVQSILNAFPIPNGPALGSGIAAYNASFSNASNLDSYSFRIDHRFHENLTLFGRYSRAPSKIIARALGGIWAASVISPAEIHTDMLTLGTTWSLSDRAVNDLRFNYSTSDSMGSQELDNFGGAVPSMPPYPNGFTNKNANFSVDIFSLSPAIGVGKAQHQKQQQINVVDNFSTQRGGHALKFGVDFRRLAPHFDPPGYSQNVFFNDVPSAVAGNVAFSVVSASRAGTLLFRNLSIFAQDNWHVSPRLTATYGLRWDVDFMPLSLNGPSLPAVTNFNNLSLIGLAPAGTPPFRTSYGNFAPRIGAAYELIENPSWQTVIRGGFGIFYDLATSEVGNGVFSFNYPFGNAVFQPGGTFPLSPSTAAPSPINFQNSGFLLGFQPGLKLPYTLQWNIAVQQSLGTQQAVTATYVGAAGRRLLQTEYVLNPNPNVQTANLILNAATSDYDALQLQFQRRLSHGWQVLLSECWSHSIDTASAGSWGVRSNTFVPAILGGSNRGPSDFDIRHTFSTGIVYELPDLSRRRVLTNLTRHWSLQSVIQARSATPVNVYDSSLFPGIGNYLTSVRPDIVQGQPLYLSGEQFPGSKALNPAAFVPPPTDSTGSALRQGHLGRNALRGFGAAQWDFSIHREFPVSERLQLQFRAELFNVLNHPNFGPPVGDITNAEFGQSTQMLGRSLDQNPGGGSFSALYQIGGPRSVQFALKLKF